MCLGTVSKASELFNIHKLNRVASRLIYCTPIVDKNQAGRYKITPRRNFPLTYEMANPPHTIAHTKSWNSWNTSNVLNGLRPSETAVEDQFIRRFVQGTWHASFISEIIIKRQHNLIRIAGLVYRSLKPSKMYFLIGYTEEFLSYWMQCPVKMELQTVADKKDVIFKYI
ncbi:small ribosomal subunit protein uS3m [Euwallacea fornicatus]|uniref:small ribosomal subunit protein uS3m n=1 Tax=Euwallacea fornicatus TaxID=995702 RepID=UPI00338F790B